MINFRNPKAARFAVTIFSMGVVALSLPASAGGHGGGGGAHMGGGGGQGGPFPRAAPSSAASYPRQRRGRPGSWQQLFQTCRRRAWHLWWLTAASRVASETDLPSRLVLVSRAVHRGSCLALSSGLNLCS